jgi:transcriptional regulator with XRE-family HTH domain
MPQHAKINRGHESCAHVVPSGEGSGARCALSAQWLGAGMPKKAAPRAGLLSDRLDHLFRTVHLKDRGPYTHAEVAEAINQAAGDDVISATYVWQLRTGRRDNPTKKHLSALAAFFGVSPMYFFDEAEAGRDAVPAELVTALKDDAVREMALRAAGLSDRSLKAISEMIESARAVEGMS